MAVTDEARLGCGRDIDDVWETADQPPSAHEQTCPFCQEARSSLSDLHRATADLLAEERTDPTLRSGPELIAGILQLARAEIRRGRRLPLTVSRGERDVAMTVSEQAVLGVIWRTGDLTPSVQARRCTLEAVPPDDRGLAGDPLLAEALELHDDPVRSADRALAADLGLPADPVPAYDEPARLAVTVQVSVAAGVSIPEAVADLRQRLAAAIRDQVGMIVTDLSIVVEDLHDQ